MATTNRPDRLTAATTACRTYADLAARCATGYAPTLRRGDRDQQALGSLLERDGHRVYWA